MANPSGHTGTELGTGTRRPPTTSSNPHPGPTVLCPSSLSALARCRSLRCVSGLNGCPRWTEAKHRQDLGRDLGVSQSLVCDRVPGGILSGGEFSSILGGLLVNPAGKAILSVELLGVPRTSLLPEARSRRGRTRHRLEGRRGCNTDEFRRTGGKSQAVAHPLLKPHRGHSSRQREP